MEIGLFDSARNSILNGTIDWVADEFKAILVSDDFVADLAKHEFISSVPQSARITLPVTLTGNQVVQGFANADSLVFKEVAGKEVAAVVIYKNNGQQTTSPLVTISNKGVGFPTMPNGGDIILSFSKDNNVFKFPTQHD